MVMSIVVSNLTKQYGTQLAVDHISFTLQKGEIVGFLGPNGAGKSTTMKMITGYLPPTDGTATVCGYDIQKNSMEMRRKIGYLPESNPLYYDMYVREYLEFSAGIHRLGKQARPRIEEMILHTGLTKESHKKIGALSKGYKQRVGLAQAMLHDPEVLILDEPTSGLDPNQIVEIRELITKMGKEKTVLLSTHIMQEVQAMCSRVIIISNGRIAANDSIDQLQHDGTAQMVILIRFDTAVDAVLFDRLPHVQKAEPLNERHWKIFTSQPEALRKEIMKWALASNLVIESMQSETKSLEAVFRDLTQKDPG